MTSKPSTYILLLPYVLWFTLVVYGHLLDDSNTKDDAL